MLGLRFHCNCEGEEVFHSSMYSVLLFVHLFVKKFIVVVFCFRCFLLGEHILRLATLGWLVAILKHYCPLFNVHFSNWHSKCSCFNELENI